MQELRIQYHTPIVCIVPLSTVLNAKETTLKICQTGVLFFRAFGTTQLKDIPDWLKTCPNIKYRILDVVSKPRKDNPKKPISEELRQTMTDFPVYVYIAHLVCSCI